MSTDRNATHPTRVGRPAGAPSGLLDTGLMADLLVAGLIGSTQRRVQLV